jgi:uncharacterized protein (DUF2147 family)
MSKSRKPRRQAAQAPRRTRRPLPILAGIAVVVGLAVVGGWWWNQSQAGGTLAAFQKLEGRWQRDDGGYIIDISRVDAGGKLTAAYLNPRPINVAKAEASMLGQTVRVYIELRDVNYPGSTYQLTYDPADDRLKGSYFQAALQETYEVAFARLKPASK